MRIAPRLVLLVAVPLVVAVAFAGRALTPATSQAVQANRLTTMIEVAASAAELTHALQRERVAATALVASEGTTARFQSRTKATDRSAERYEEKRGEVSSTPEGSGAALERIDRSLAELPSLRAQVRSGSGALSSLAFGYRIVVADLITYRDSIAQAEGVDPGIADRIRAAAALSKAAEHLGQQQVVVARALDGGGLTPAAQRSFDATRLGYTEATGDVYTLGPAEWRSWLERSLAGPKALAAQRMEDEVGRSTAGQALPLSWTKWEANSTERLTMLHGVEKRIDAAVLDTANEKRTSLIWWAVGELLAVLLTLAVALGIAYQLGRAMIRRLRHLRNAAHDVANKRLPEVMTDLSQPRALGSSTPEQIAERAGNPLPSTGKDEIDEVGQAFNAVHYEAVRLAAQQAASHEQFADTLVGVARRGAVLTGVMASQLDQVQREELDPERMDVLFALDHLAIRMDRNTNNLLVLGGHGRGKVRTADAPCTDVVFAAAQQIERYGRVTLGHVEPGLGIAARYVDDVAHLLAELLDNATRFSPPDTKVGVAAWRLWDRAVVQIVDEGVGIPQERRLSFNTRLAEPRADLGAAVRSMGLHVVARIAGRHGITVELRASSGPGTIAEVTLPEKCLAELPRTPDLLGGGGLRDKAVQEKTVRRKVAEAAEAAAEDDGAPKSTALEKRTPAETSPTTAASPTTAPPATAMPASAPPATAQPASAPPATAGPVRTVSGEPPAAESTGPAGPAVPPKPATAPSAGAPRVPRPRTEVPTEPRVAGFSSSGLPIRRRALPEEMPGAAATPGAERGGGRPGGAAKGTKSAKGAARSGGTRTTPPRRRDSRQVSDVLAAYAQGINRSTRNKGGREAGASADAARDTDDR
ncbi:nitrate- and nitrite sensing domain-containing protein [Streptomyces sp. NPDC048172]|uniref:sensor histidine kinase n=1 Tax=Streptomyces sp. NPDC048172 TaxID=3365505 RepID=UPI003719AF1A